MSTRQKIVLGMGLMLAIGCAIGAGLNQGEPKWVKGVYEGSPQGHRVQCTVYVRTDRILSVDVSADVHSVNVGDAPVILAEGEWEKIK
ncbi:MAG: hypothetical protein WCJ35_23620 [Planctomycetota bacterium]